MNGFLGRVVRFAQPDLDLEIAIPPGITTTKPEQDVPVDRANAGKRAFWVTHHPPYRPSSGRTGSTAAHSAATSLMRARLAPSLRVAIVQGCGTSAVAGRTLPAKRAATAGNIHSRSGGHEFRQRRKREHAMKRTILFVGCAALMGTAIACKDQGQSAVSPNQPMSANRGPNATNRSPNALNPTQSPTPNATDRAQNATEVAGTLKSVDKDKHSLTIAASAGGTQDVKIADSAAITRDGAKVDLDQLQPGDDVRASFDPATKQASTITVKSNQTNKAK
ncbi:MAG: hypothetical protein E6J62_08880 [Deltaproteobacteria bacterium]|nr:MAG: hypothetical protein E6J61_06030 [Deltaproteobacteria bacterium]TMB35789.1 MAG: hypothetical protein E6J62_08880 [Deltaproteobacteria bacterium]